MWKKLVSPEILFFLGTLQALLPYFIWYIDGLNPLYRYDVTYLPIVIWGVGYLCFWVGTQLYPTPSMQHPSDAIVTVPLHQIKVAIALILGITIVQLVQTAQVYGGLPLLGYLAGTMNVAEANDLQRNSGFGQFGMLTVTLFLLNGLLLTLAIKGLETNRKVTLFFATSASVGLFGALIAGKRQGFMMLIMYMVCGFVLRFKQPIDALLTMLSLPTRRWFKAIAGAAIALAIVSLVGVLSSVRTGRGESVSGISEILNYLQFPLINLEAQCQEVGFGPFQFNVIYPLLNLLPYKIIETFPLLPNELPLRPEPTIGAGFYGGVHWGLGMIGVIIMAIGTGFISKYFYAKSFHNLAHLLVYCQISWTLISAHTYNHFLNLIFIPIPATLMFIIALVFNSNRRSQNHLETVSESDRKSIAAIADSLKGK